MARIGITADIHFGVPGRADDILWACRVMREYCANFGLDVMLILGDLYHDRRAIEIDVNSQVCQFFEETKEKYGLTCSFDTHGTSTA
jgi:DNA repair exonuclease SbcCD nuclease subunit